ncbi:MAG: EF-P lysine aminoacylase GenX [Gammaproteobacteria bacterium]|nr:EF-P lysine aminoacylase GenX [Gammaproteobacteria bacterium]
MSPATRSTAATPPTTAVRWRPGTSREMLALRARMAAALREFFALRDVLEVDTPICVNAGVTDVNIHSAVALVGERKLYLHTSPEYAMKRLLAAGSGDIFQLCHVIRSDETGPLHNPEFSLLEWYRLGFTLEQLATEVAELLNHWLAIAGRAPRPLQFARYRDLFVAALAVDPLEAPLEILRGLAARHGLDRASGDTLDRDALLDFLMGVVVGPTLGTAQWLAVTHYPASQAALSQLDPHDPRVALRFEIYGDGIELANGFVELADAKEQARRFAQDAALRAARATIPIEADARLLAALREGLPACAGVAVGFDRCVMIMSGEREIARVMPFTTDEA